MLFKFCKPEHNPLNGASTLRLGTLEYYRDMDPAFAIADPLEGVDTYRVNYIQDAPNSHETRQFLESNGMVFEGQRGILKDVTFVQRYPNCYIWCCRRLTAQPNSTDGVGLSPEYTSWYQIPHIGNFCNYLTDRIRDELTVNVFSPEAQQYIFDHSLELGDVEIIRMGGPVLYVEKKQGMYDVDGVRHYASLPAELRPIFVKTGKYRDDIEYRFVFAFACPKTGTLLAVKPEPWDVMATPSPPII